MERSPGPTRPDRLTTWPVELGEFGVDVEWRTGRGEPPRDGDQGLARRRRREASAESGRRRAHVDACAWAGCAATRSCARSRTFCGEAARLRSARLTSARVNV